MANNRFGTCFPIHIGNVIIPTDEFIFFQRGRAQPPTRYSFQKLGGTNEPTTLVIFSIGPFILLGLIGLILWTLTQMMVAL